jgi:NAD(P)-dependent dehydrogenase (short-subunit alcohol dehydrogenase family)
MRQLEGKLAVITGGGRGIGRAIALALARAGASVALTGRNMRNLEETTEAIRAESESAIAIACDVADKASVRSAFERIRSGLGAADILVNNAGITYSSKLHQTPEEVWEQIIQTNVNGTFYCCKAVLPDMIQKREGHIIVIASIAGTVGMAYSAAYSASKHAQLGIVRSLALESKRYNIAVNAICPAWVETDMFENTIQNLVKTTGRTAETARADLLRMSGQTQAVAPEQVAEEALRLACLADTTITGQAIPLL